MIFGEDTYGEKWVKELAQLGERKKTKKTKSPWWCRAKNWSFIEIGSNQKKLLEQQI